MMTKKMIRKEIPREADRDRVQVPDVADLVQVKDVVEVHLLVDANHHPRLKKYA